MKGIVKKFLDTIFHKDLSFSRGEYSNGFSLIHFYCDGYNNSILSITMPPSGSEYSFRVSYELGLKIQNYLGVDKNDIDDIVFEWVKEKCIKQGENEILKHI